MDCVFFVVDSLYVSFLQEICVPVFLSLPFVPRYKSTDFFPFLAVTRCESTGLVVCSPRFRFSGIHFLKLHT